MADSPPRHESADNQGSTLQQSGTVGVAPGIDVPAVAGAPISEFIVQCPDDQDIDARLKISLDGGTNFLTMQPAGHWAWTPKGDSVKQIRLEGNQAGVEYEIVLNREVD